MKSTPILFSVLLSLWSTFSQAENKVYTFGVVPQQAATKLAKQWAPLLAQLSKQSGITLRFKTAPNISDFEKRLVAGEYDFAYMNPYHYTIAHQKPGYQAIAKTRDKNLTGIIVVPHDSKITRIEQLDGKNVAFPAPGAFAATLLPLAFLQQKQISVSPHYVSSHDSVYQNIALGQYEAGGGITRTFDNSAFKNKLRILWTSPPHTPHAFAAHPALPKDVVQKVQLTMTKLHETPQGKKLLTQLGLNALQAANDKQWDDIRLLNIKLLDHLLQ